MNKQPCELIQDILPLFVEDSVSNTTNEIVKGHLKECPTCQELCDELKLPDFVLPDLKESLPEVDTFKRWSKRLTVTGVIGLILIILVGIGIGVLSYRAGSSVEKDILSVKDVTKALKQAGLILKSDSKVNPGDHKIGQVEPSIYKVNNLDGVLLIYNFASVGERDTIYQQWKETNRKNNSENNTNNISERWQYNVGFGAKNTLIVMGVSQFPNEEYAQKIRPVITSLGKTIFYDLNGGQQIIFQGEGENWKGKVIYNYYNNFWTDDKGVIRYDGWSHKQPLLEFKEDPNSIHGDFSYKFNSPFGEFGGTSSDGLDPQQFRERDTSANYGGMFLGFEGIGGGGAIPQKDSFYTLTLKWNNQQETVVLKATE